ncbi:MAG TPA: CHAT domain-containing protein [Candidatus Angelobacter sp.]|jgi:CHAT domain-containing protein/Tfp pilus assembly protein PilF
MARSFDFRFLNGLNAIRRLTALAVVCLFSCALPAQTAPSQTPASPATQATAQTPEAIVLEPGKTVGGDLSGGQKAVFKISISEGQYANVIIDQHTLDLTLRLLDPKGTLAIETDISPREARDVFAFVAEKPGTYQIQLEPKYPRASAGKYQISLGELRAASEKDITLYHANQQYSEAFNLYPTGAYAKAQSLAEHALDTREKVLGPDHRKIADALNLLGVICTARSDYSRAETLLHRALAIDEKALGADHPTVAEVMDNLAKNHNAKADYAEAERLAREALSIREKALGPDHVLVAVSLGTLGDIFFAKGDYVNARAFSERALEVTGKSYTQEDMAYSDAASRLARVQIKQGNYSAAEQLLTQSLRTREVAAGKDSLQAADSLFDLGYFYLLKIDNVKSEQLNLQALALKEKILGPEHLQIALILHNLGLIYYRRGDYSTAETYYQRALAIKEKTLGPTHPFLAATVNNLGLMYWRQRDYPKATKFFSRALEICESAYGPESADVTFPLANLGIIYKETGDYDRAEVYYKRALAIEEKIFGPENPRVGVTYESLGILYRDKGDYAKAEPFFLHAIAITEKSLGPDHPDNARHFRNLEHLYAAKGDLPNALKSLARITEIEEKNLPLNLAIGSERQKLAYFDPMAEQLEKTISFQAQQDAGDSEARDLATTTLLQRKGRVLDAMADNMGALWNRSSVEDRSLLDQLKSVTSQLAALVLKGPQGLSIAEHQQRIKALTQRREQLENEVGRRSQGYYERSDAVTLSAVKAAIPSDAALIEFAVYRPFDPKKPNESTTNFGDPRYVVYVIPGSGDVRWKDLGASREIDAAVAAFRRALRDPQRRDVKQLARALDEKIMQPVRELTGNATHLLVAPDGQLDLIPFEALVDSQGRYLIERFSVTYLTTGRDLLRMQVSRDSKTGPLVIADPAFGEPGTTTVASVEQSHLRPASTLNRRRSITTAQDLSAVYFAPLGGTALEAHAIQSLFPDAHVLTGAHATKSALKRIDAPSILHIATHGFFLEDSPEVSLPNNAKPAPNGTRSVHGGAAIENPLLRSGLALSGANVTKTSSEDGILTALEASNLNLWGTKLVTLSACDTGLGEVRNGEGVYGLRRAFFLSGAETLVMSLWPVSDDVTREMMTAYYTGLKQGLGRGEALHQAELSMLKRKGRQHPFYWASFIQSGDWASLDDKK